MSRAIDGAAMLVIVEPIRSRTSAIRVTARTAQRRRVIRDQCLCEGWDGRAVTVVGAAELWSPAWV